MRQMHRCRLTRLLTKVFIMMLLFDRMCNGEECPLTGLPGFGRYNPSATTHMNLMINRGWLRPMIR